jgi:hypothetical protein
VDPASIFILLVVLALAVGGGAFLFLTSAGLELREGRRRVARPRPKHLKVENPEHVISSPLPTSVPAVGERSKPGAQRVSPSEEPTTVEAQADPPKDKQSPASTTDPRRQHTDPEFDSDEHDRAEPQIDPTGDIG